MRALSLTDFCCVKGCLPPSYQLPLALRLILCLEYVQCLNTDASETGAVWCLLNVTNSRAVLLKIWLLPWQLGETAVTDIGQTS